MKEEEFQVLNNEQCVCESQTTQKKTMGIRPLAFCCHFQSPSRLKHKYCTQFNHIFACFLTDYQVDSIVSYVQNAPLLTAPKQIA